MPLFAAVAEDILGEPVAFVDVIARAAPTDSPIEGARFVKGNLLRRA